MTRFSRRNLMKAGVTSGVLVGLAGTGAWFGRDWIKRLQPQEMAEYLRANFDYLTFNFNEDKFLEYAKEYREHYEEISRELWSDLRGRGSEQHREEIDQFATRFLMSTDFFMYGADESRPINYVMFYHPYRSPCWNPLSMQA